MKRRFLVRRLLQVIPTVLGITALTFGIAQLAPGDPLQLDPEAPVSAAAVEHARARAGLDRPLPLQYARWLARVATLDFGTSLVDQRPVRSKLAEALPRTLLLSGLSLLVALLFAVPLGVFAARSPRGLPQRLLGAGLVALYALPTFWVAVLLLLALAGPRSLELFPFQGLHSEAPPPGVAGLVDLAWHLALPVAVLAYPALAVLTQQVRGAMVEALGQEYVRAARARGSSERSVLYRHALPNALLPLITSVGSLLPHLVGGSVIVERVFGIQGMGLLAFDAISTRDYPTLMAATTLGALATVLSVLAADLLAARADPRVRLEAARG